MSFSVSCGALRPRVVRPAPVRPAPADASTRGSSRSSARSSAGCGRRGGRSTRRTTRSGRSTSTSTSGGYSRRFRRHFLVPLTSALWSTAPGRALEFPAAYAIRFFEQPRHARVRPLPLADGDGRGRDLRPRARSNGSRAALHLGLGVRALRRMPDGVELRTDDDVARRFDAAVVATHADEALACSPTRAPRSAGCSAPSAHAERRRPAHRRALPAADARRARASWNYQLERRR